MRAWVTISTLNSVRSKIARSGEPQYFRRFTHQLAISLELFGVVAFRGPSKYYPLRKSMLWGVSGPWEGDGAHRNSLVVLTESPHLRVIPISEWVP